MSFNAFIFDLDGVITDTAIYHFQAWKRCAEALGISFTEEDNESLKGVSRRGSLEWIINKGGITLSEAEFEHRMAAKNDDYKELIQDITEADIFPGVEALLKALRERGIKIGLASASKNAQTIIDRLGLTGSFDYIADAGQIPNSKPAPDIFLDVMQTFAMTPDECVGIEDAQAGIVAIKAAGMKAVGIGTPDALSGADIIYPDMAAFDLDEVLKLA